MKHSQWHIFSVYLCDFSVTLRVNPLLHGESAKNYGVYFHATNLFVS